MNSIKVSKEETYVIKRALELFLEYTKKDCPEMPIALEIHRKFIFKDIEEVSIEGVEEMMGSLESLKGWNVK